MNKADNKMRSEGACALSEALKVNTALKRLYLWSMHHQQDDVI